MSFELFIGGRYLRARQKQSFISLITILSVVGVMVGVMALIVVIAVMAGFETDLKSRILGVESHIVIMRRGGVFSDYQSVLEHIKKINGVKQAAPFIYTQVMLKSSSGVSGAVLKGVDPKSEGQIVKNLHALLLRNREPEGKNSVYSNAAPGIILGKQLATKLNVIKGDNLYLISPAGMISPVGYLPSMKQYAVKDTFESGIHDYDESLAYINIKDAQKILRMNDSITGIEVNVSDIYSARNIAENIVDALGFPYWARDWMQMNKNLFSALKLEKTVMFIILTLIVLVAALNIASSLIMMVMEKTKDIAILKAMGATDMSIRKIFVFKGMIIGSVGTSLGVCSGYILCKLLEKYKFIDLPGDVYYITTLPVRLVASDVLLIAVAALVICFLATLYPAHQASKLNPVEAIRHG
ncbi:MAG: lipoprotein-releasing ABC transporter permease subunit [Desulfobacterium sp.]|nr:lipoprotein-releasing ABC transporter permease subunit [Desulfobacterium sp.]MBU3947052.1 lipoprotein-releasing ABC transporter permease subunit [Pseudomonadota bacterium]MBU4037239.1 lipoprotein-releasing ABC transporter permease subunit [Pseudomonadota bacterium]